MTLFPLGLYVFSLFSQYLDAADHEDESDEEGDLLRTWIRFGLGRALIVVGVEALVRAAIGLGDAFGTPAFLRGMTVGAAGSSFPDAFVSVAAARADRLGPKRWATRRSREKQELSSRYRVDSSARGNGSSGEPGR